MIDIELRTYSKEALAREFSSKYNCRVIDAFSRNLESESNKRSNRPSKKTKQITSRKSANSIPSGADIPSYRLIFASSGIYLCASDAVKISVDFVSGELAHRRKFGGGKGQMIAKAVGLNKGFVPNIIDATAGLGGDAFVLACMGCKVTMVERSPVARLLLSDGLLRARESVLDAEDDDSLELSNILERMTLVDGDSLLLLRDFDWLSQQKVMPDVVYLDPMFPERKKTAQVKKGMRAFHETIGGDSDADDLLGIALDIAEYRVVVKRPKVAPFLDASKPSYQLLGKSSRYDIYTKKAIP